MKAVISKTKNHEFIYIRKSFRSNGKCSSKNVKSLGKMEDLIKIHGSRDNVIEYANKIANDLTLKEKADQSDVIIKYSSSKIIEKNERRTFNGGYVFLKDIFYDLNLHKICKDISDRYRFKYNLTDILEKLIYTRILFPSSKLSSFEVSKMFLEQPDFHLEDIYRALDILYKEKDFIESEIYKNSLNVIDRNANVLYYDCTNYFFEIEEADGIRQYGISKEHRPNPITQMGLFLDGNGIPLAFNINPGNQNEQLSLRPTEERIIKDFELSKFVICTDGGLDSIDNRKFNIMSGRSYIVTQSIKKLKKHLIEWCLDKKGWYYINEEGKRITADLDNIELNKDILYYKERWIHENGLEQRLILSYSLRYAEYQQHVRESQVERAKKMADKNIGKSVRNQNDPARFNTISHITDNGEVATKINVELSEEKIENEKRFDGLYAVCTTLEDDISTILKINKRRWEIEESFRIMKSEFKARPVHLQKDERIIAHFLICFLALLAYRILEHKLESKYTVHEITETLKHMDFLKIKGEGYIPSYTRTDITDDLHTLFGFRTDTQIVTSNKMKKILSSTKK